MTNFEKAANMLEKEEQTLEVIGEIFMTFCPQNYGLEGLHSCSYMGWDKCDPMECVRCWMMEAVEDDE